MKDKGSEGDWHDIYSTVYSIGSRENTSRKSSYHLIPRESTLRNPKRSYCKIRPLYLVNRTAQSVSKARTVMILLWGAPLAVVYKWWVYCRPPRSNFIDDTKDFKKNHLFKILDVLLDIIGFIRKKRWKRWKSYNQAKGLLTFGEGVSLLAICRTRGVFNSLSYCRWKRDPGLIFCQGDYTCFGKTQLIDVYFREIINQCNVSPKICQVILTTWTEPTFLTSLINEFQVNI